MYHTADILKFTGIPQYIQDQWALAVEDLQSEVTDGRSPAAEENVWPDPPLEMVKLVTLEDQNFLTIPESYVNKEQGGLLTMGNYAPKKSA